MTYLKHHLLESSDKELPQEESCEDYTLRNPNWNLEENDLQKPEISNDYIKGLFDDYVQFRGRDFEFNCSCLAPACYGTDKWKTFNKCEVLGCLEWFSYRSNKRI